MAPAPAAPVKLFEDAKPSLGASIDALTPLNQAALKMATMSVGKKLHKAEQEIAKASLQDWRQLERELIPLLGLTLSPAGKGQHRGERASRLAAGRGRAGAAQL